MEVSANQRVTKAESEMDSWGRDVPFSQRLSRDDIRADPLFKLDDLCVSTLLNFLSMRDLISCSGVSSHWRHRLELIVTERKIRTYFPFFKPPRATYRGQRMRDFRRLAWRDACLSKATPSWYCHLHNAAHYSVAGNYAVWCRNRTYEVNWLELRRSDMKKLRLPVIDHFSPMEVEDLLVSEGGIVFVRGILEGGLIKIYRDQTYRLSDGKLLWYQDSCDPKMTKPLFLGPKRAYFLSTSLNTLSTDTKMFLCAICIQSGETFYECEISHTAPHDYYRDVYKLVSLQDLDFIIDLSNKREDYFAIINGATGKVTQRIKHKGLCGYNVMATPNTANKEFVLWSPAVIVQDTPRRGDSKPIRRVVQQTYTMVHRMEFVLTNFRMILHNYGANFVVHPYGDYGFCADMNGLHVLKIVPDTKNNTQDPPTDRRMRRYRVSSVKTVPANEVKMRWWEQNCEVVMFDQARVVFRDKEEVVHSFDFGPAW